MLEKATSSDPDPAPKGPAVSVAARFRTLAQQCNAEKYELFRLRGQDHALVPVLELGPKPLQSSAHGPTFLPKELAHSAATTACILWWDGAEGGLENSLNGLDWAIRIKAGASPPGLGLPLAARDGARGIAVFLGERLCTGAESLIDIHARCHALFDELPEIMPEREESGLPAISRRELQCLKLTACGLTSEEIAHELGLSVHTANQYLTNATQKLNATNRIHAVAKALQEGLID